MEYENRRGRQRRFSLAQLHIKTDFVGGINGVSLTPPAEAGTADARWAIPTKVFENERAMVIAGFANEVDEVNQYAAPMNNQ